MNRKMNYQIEKKLADLVKVTKNLEDDAICPGCK